MILSLIMLTINFEMSIIGNLFYVLMCLLGLSISLAIISSNFFYGVAVIN